MHRVFDLRNFAMTAAKIARHTLQHMTKKSDFERVAATLQRVAQYGRIFCATLCNMLQQIRVGQRVAGKTHSTQWGGRLRNTATLLSLKNRISTHTHTYTYAYRGNIETALHVLRPMRSVRS